ncbi:hypothetical protein [Georgenia sp. H159]|uniref:hypothetical protein n=1 Tax=Georgenia sp. H159 TaxID=3076115 RepID=UPI002D773412|nr:hypothetical protein [Georgenia sp. H159]
MAANSALAIALIIVSSGVFSGHGEGDAVKVRAESNGRTEIQSSGQHGGYAASTGGEPAEPYCPPTLYTFGVIKKVLTDCDAAGGTELTPIFDNNEVDEGDPEVVPQRRVFTVSREDVQSLLVSPGSLEIQPDQPWVLVNTDTIVLTDSAEHVLVTQVLGYDVDVRVTPVLFTWDFGDGSPPLTGTDPGAPWPNHTVSHAYGEAGVVSISLRTEWDAAFRVEGTSAWIPVTGRAVTTLTSEPVEVVTATPRLTAG